METPRVVVDLKRVQENIRRFQNEADRHNILVRPHIKTHKLPRLAKMQLEAGAIGITCQKIGEAEVMADAGIEDILITYNILGPEKLARLKALSKKCTLSATADNSVVVAGLSKTFADSEAALPVLVECDTGAKRCGVQSPQEALALAREIVALPGLTFQGLMTYPPMDDLKQVEAWLTEAKSLLSANDIPCPTISSGGSPNMWRLDEIPSATEHRIGTYIYNDKYLVTAGVCDYEDCALTVVATVVSRPVAGRAVIDAGSKVLTSDLLGMTGYGHVVGAPGAVISELSEEHGVINLDSSDWSPEVGDTVSIIPNHVCVVSNMVDEVVFVEADGRTSKVPVAARGKVQ